MTYRELLGYAQKKIDNNEITVGEYVEMTKVLNREIDAIDKIRAEIEQIIGEHNLDDYDYCSGLICARKIIDKYRKRGNE